MITITDRGNKAILTAPFHPQCSPMAREIGGKWNPENKTWVFDARDRSRVEELAATLWGYNANASGATASVRIQATKHLSDGDIVRFAGREVAKKWSRDERPRLAEGVVIFEGAFSQKGGSARYPAIESVDDDVILEIRDLPVEALESESDYTLIDGDPKAALRAEREQLVARIAEIDAQL